VECGVEWIEHKLYDIKAKNLLSVSYGFINIFVMKRKSSRFLSNYFAAEPVSVQILLKAIVPSVGETFCQKYISHSKNAVKHCIGWSFYMKQTTCRMWNSSPSMQTVRN